MLVNLYQNTYKPNFNAGKYEFLNRTYNTAQEAIAALTDEYNALPDSDKLSMKAMILLKKITQYSETLLSPDQIEKLARTKTLEQIGVITEDRFGYIPKKLKEIVQKPEVPKSRNL